MSRYIPKRYFLEETLGNSTFGVCYKVKDQHEGDKLKVIKQIVINGEVVKLDEVIKESKAMYKLDHSFIMKCFDDFSAPGFYYIVLEYCESDLSKHLKKLETQKQKLTHDEIMDWFIQLLSGVKYIHSNKLIHRDLKPPNILLKTSRYTDKMILKIGDLGEVKNLQHTISLATTHGVGTVAYFSPEVLDENPHYDNKTDIWSLGCVLFEMCTGDVLFKGRNENVIMDKIKDAKDLKMTYSDADLNSIFQRMMTKSKHERPSAKEILKMPVLKSYLEEKIKNKISRSTKSMISTTKFISLYATALDTDDEDGDGLKTSLISTNGAPGVANTGNNEIQNFATRLSKWKINSVVGQRNIIKIEKNNTEDLKNWLDKSSGLPADLNKNLINNLTEQRWPSKFEANMSEYTSNIFLL